MRLMDCGHELPDLPARRFGGADYGIDKDGRKLCLACCHALDVESLKDRTRPFGAYLSLDGKNITNWPGAPLMRVTYETTSRTGWHGSTMTHVRAIDVHGGRWYGKGAGRGMFVRLHPARG